MAFMIYGKFIGRKNQKGQLEMAKHKYSKARLKELLPDINPNDVDAVMIPILIELNSKNWYTFGCCEGHPERKYRGYIAFKNVYDFPNRPRYIEESKKAADWWDFNGPKELVLEELLRWAISLPTREPIVTTKYFVEIYNSDYKFKGSYEFDNWDEVEKLFENKKVHHIQIYKETTVY